MTDHPFLVATPSHLQPRTVEQSCVIGDTTWTLTWSADLDPAVRDGETLRATVHQALEAAMAVVAKKPWRTTVDVAGTIFAVAIQPKTARIALGSPRFSTEQTLLWALRDSQLDLTALQELVHAWQDADPAAAPLVVDTVAAANGLTELLARHEAQWPTLLERIHARARTLHARTQAYRPPLMERLSQDGLEACAQSAVLRIHLLRFVAALPSLDHDVEGREVARLLRETLGNMADDSAQLRTDGGTGERSPLPAWLETLCRLGWRLLPLVPALWLATATRAGVRKLASYFIAGQTVQQAGQTLALLRATGRDATLDQLGELVVCEAEADTYAERVQALLDGVAHFAQKSRNAADLPRAHVSVKTSALCSDFNPDDPDGTWRRVGPRLVQILRHAKALGACIQLDAEHYSVRDLNLKMLDRALKETDDLHDWADVGIVVQAYLRDAPQHVESVLALARKRGLRMPLRLVKGAYWDAETTEAAAHDYLAPQWLNKAETDATFQLLTLRALEAHDAVQLCVGSHNLRDHVFAHEARALFYPHAAPIEHQVLHQSYEALSTALAREGWAVRHYVPVGSLLVGMAYLVRRILENSSQVGVLTMARHGADLRALLEMPGNVLATQTLARDDLNSADPLNALPPFRNVAPARLYLDDHRAALEDAFVHQRALALLPKEPVFPRHGPREPCPSPSQPERVLAEIRLCAQPDVRPAVARALGTPWLKWSAGLRAAVLLRAAERLRVLRMDAGALVAAEAGKARLEALGDVDEAIDFLQFYAREALTLPQQTQPLGVVAVVAPWNFPLAIPTGMVAGALAAGNAVILKAAEQTPLCAEFLVQVLRDAGIPDDAVQHLPGDGWEVSSVLVAHPLVHGCVFTGSVEVGLTISQRMLHKGHGRAFHRVVTEMGGKNAILVTATADLDEAVSGCLQSAFGHAGQKCSAASRILVDKRVMPAFRTRFGQAASELVLGKAETPGTRVNPVIREEERDRLREAAEAAVAEINALGGRVLVDRSQETVDDAWTVGPVVLEFADSQLPPSSLAHREQFGPIVHLIPFEDLAHGVRLVNQSPYALTGGVFSQSQADIAFVVDELRVGNLYVNRAITGARVAVEPFGGFQLSGTGPKAGGPGYVQAFTYVATQDAPLDAQTLQVIDNRCAKPGDRPHAHAPHDDGTLLREAASLRNVGEPTRVIPGQHTHNIWSMPRGATLVLTGHGQPLAGTLGHANAAQAMGNDVRVMTLSDGAHATWRTLNRFPLERVTEMPRLIEILNLPHWATIILDGEATDFATLVELVAQIPAEGRDTRQVLLGAQAVPSARETLKLHAHTRTVAVHTMRHGAPLVL